MTLDQFLSIPRLRRELDIPDAYTAENDHLTDLRSEAAATIQRVTNLPVIDQPVVLYAEPTAFSGLPLCLDTSFVVDGPDNRLHFWTPDQNASEEPGGMTQIARFETSNHRHGPYWLWPAGTWPERLAGTKIRATLMRGVPATDQEFAGVIRSCGVELVRQRKQGIRTMAPTNYTLRILEELKSL